MVSPLLSPYEGCVMQRDGLEDSGCVRLSVGGWGRLGQVGCWRLYQVGVGWVLAVVSGWGRLGQVGCQVDIRWDIRLTWLAVVSRESRG